MNSGPPKKPEKKSLEHMMQECSNMITKEKLQSFTKAQHQTQQQPYKPGQHILPSVSKPSRFPSWCCKEIVPPLYHHIEAYVTEEYQHGVSNGLLLPVLTSSGLHREVLAHIWEMTNQDTPGVLSSEELYAALAIVALYQAGYNVQSMEALHYFPAPPIPVLHPPNIATPSPPPPTISPGPVPSHSPNLVTETIPDDFGDFKQAVEETSPSDDFGDFKVAFPDTPVSIPDNPVSIPDNPVSIPDNPVSIPVLGNPVVENTQDKYAVFKLLEDPVVDETPEVSLPVIETIVTSASDDFGDFLCADSIPAPTATIEQPLKPQFKISVNFESDNFKKIVDWGGATSSTSEPKTPIESPVYIYDPDNLDSVSISSFHHSPIRSIKTDDDISFDKLSLNQLGETTDPATLSVSSQESTTDPALEDFDTSEKVISSVPLADRYSFIRNEAEVTLDIVSSEWLRCLTKCKDILSEAKQILLSIKEMNVSELFQTEEVQNYIKDFTQVYCVVRRIYAASLSSGRYTGDIQSKLRQVDELWEDLSPLHKLPEKNQFDFTWAAISPTQEQGVCGVCLLDINTGFMTGIKEEENAKLTYGGREYHTSCANLWVNGVDFLLPGLKNAELL